MLFIDGNSLPDSLLEEIQEILNNKLAPIEDNLGDDEEDPIEDLDVSVVDEMINKI